MFETIQKVTLAPSGCKHVRRRRSFYSSIPPIFWSNSPSFRGSDPLVNWDRLWKYSILSGNSSSNPDFLRGSMLIHWRIWCGNVRNPHLRNTSRPSPRPANCRLTLWGRSRIWRRTGSSCWNLAPASRPISLSTIPWVSIPPMKRRERPELLGELFGRRGAWKKNSDPPKRSNRNLKYLKSEVDIVCIDILWHVFPLFRSHQPSSTIDILFPLSHKGVRPLNKR